MIALSDGGLISLQAVAAECSSVVLSTTRCGMSTRKVKNFDETLLSQGIIEEHSYYMIFTDI